MYVNDAYYLERENRRNQLIACLAPAFDFQPINSQMRDLFLRYQPDTMMSSRCFLSLYAYAREDVIIYWEDTELHYLVLLFIDRENRLNAYPPLGPYREETFSRMIARMYSMFRLAKEPFRFDHIGEEELARFQGLSGYRFYPTTTEDEDDYVYEIERLTNFDGPENYNRRMNHNKFLRRHELRIEFVREDVWADCERVMDGWCGDRNCESCGFRCPRTTATRAMHHLDKIHATGSLMYMDGEPEAMVILGMMGREMADLLTIFSIHRYPGLTYSLLDETCRLCLPGVKYLNLEEDLGIPNLRKFKSSLHPVMKIKKYQAHVVSNVPFGIKALEG